MLAVFSSLKHKSQVDIVTSSPILASEGAKKMKDFYQIFDLTVSDNSKSLEDPKCYQSTIVYGSIDTFQSDFLR